MDKTSLRHPAMTRHVPMNLLNFTTLLLGTEELRLEAVDGNALGVLALPTVGPILSTLFHAVPTPAPALRIPRPICTVDFPSEAAVAKPPRKRSRRGSLPASVSVPKDPEDCAICLESLSMETLCLPCGHQYHRLCLFSLLTSPVLPSVGITKKKMSAAVLGFRQHGSVSNVSCYRGPLRPPGTRL